MADLYKYEKMDFYPHMKPNDRAIWERFIEKNPEAFDKVQYDVLVGSVPAFDTTVNPSTGGNVADLYRKKIDVVGYKGAQISIIELKPEAQISSIGQLLGYVELYKKEYKPALEPFAILLTDRIMLDMQELTAKYGIKLITA